jgi:hypothetical protein
MKNVFFFSVILLGVLGFTFIEKEAGVMSDYACDSSLSKFNVLAGKTGAPGEANCTQCHSGTALSGVGTNTLIFSGANDEYVPGQTYTFSLDVLNSTSTGFQMTGLDNSNDKAGSFTAGTGSNIQTSSGKEYINHSNASVSSWTFDWTAPATDVGDVTFYLASNKANGDNSTSGDDIYLSELLISAASSSNVEQLSALSNSDFNISFNASSNEINLDYIASVSGKVTVKVFNIKGEEITMKKFGNSSQGKNFNHLKLRRQLSTGVYLVTLGINSEYFTKKLFVQYN